MKKKILLVEYATTSIDIIKETLSHPIFEITTANEGDTAKHYLSEKSFDLMITAAMLPKFHGFNLSQYAAEHCPGIKIIIMSEIYRGMDYKHQATTIYKADDFFEKPLDKETFKKRIFELLDLSEESLKTHSRMTTTQVPISDTKKIPTLKKLEEEKKLSSVDLFGDIIEKIHDLPSYEINLDGMDKGISKGLRKPQELISPVTQKMDTKKAAVPQKSPTVTHVLKTQEVGKTQKIDQELLDLIKTGRKEKKPEGKKPEQKFKKIENDISRKLEDTLSGLGLTGKPAPAPSRTPSPAAAKETAQPTEEITPIKPPETKPKEIEKADEVGGYEILGLIGRGGMAEIYKAKKKGVKGFEKVIALKKILSGYGTDAKFIEMFVDEAKIAVELSHPNIVQIHDLGKKDDYYFIAMEYVFGKDLRVILQKLTRLGITMPEELAIYLVIKILEALNYAHAARDSKGKKLDIVHRDVSPPNILVSYEGNIKLTDFGVSKASTKMHQTLAGALKGKLLYMSPEQARGESNIDYRSDLYSAGIILFELITGEKLFLGSSEIVTLKKVQEGTVIKPSLIKKDIEPELETIILKALNKDIEHRYQKASDFIRDLETYMGNHYDSMPETAHIMHFIYDLFKDEIIKEGIEINLPPHPSPLIKKSKKEAAIKEVIKAEEEEIPGLPEENPLDILPWNQVEKAVEKETKPEIQGKEEFEPIIEINFDEEEKKVTPAPPPTPPLGLTPFESLTLDREVKKKKNILVAALIVIVIIALAIVLFFIFSSGGSGPSGPGSEGSGPGPGSAAVTTETTGTAGTSGTPTPATAEVPSSQPDIKPTDTGQPSPQTTPPATEAGSPITEKKPGKEGIPPKEKEKTSEAAKVSAAPPPTSPQPTKETPVDETEKKKPKEKKTEPEAVGVQEPPPQKDKPGGEEKKGEAVEETKPAEAKPSTPGALTEKPAEEVTPGPDQEEIFKEGDILSPSQVDTQPIPLSTPPLEISSGIRRLLTSDQRILVSYLIDHNGNVETVQVLNQSSLKRLNSLIIESIKKWKYKPATKNNVKVKVWKNQWIAIKK